MALNRGGIKHKLGLADLAAPAVKEVKEVCHTSGLYLIPTIFYNGDTNFDLVN